MFLSWQALWVLPALLKVMSTTELQVTQKYYPGPAHSKGNTGFLDASKLIGASSYLLVCDGDSLQANRST